MKKKNLKTLKLKKNVISNLEESKVNGGGGREARTESSCWFPCIAECFSIPCW